MSALVRFTRCRGESFPATFSHGTIRERPQGLFTLVPHCDVGLLGTGAGQLGEQLIGRRRIDLCPCRRQDLRRIDLDVAATGSAGRGVVAADLRGGEAQLVDRGVGDAAREIVERAGAQVGGARVADPDCAAGCGREVTALLVIAGRWST